jgi:polyisoprenoid-binding protein YceI
MMVAVLLSAAAANASAAPEVYQVASGAHGKVRFKVEGPLDDVQGETRAVSGRLELDPASWASGGKAAVQVPLESLRTGIDQRDADMREQFLQTDRYPRALLLVDKIERPSAASLAPGGTVEGEAFGSFELHGVRRAVRLPVKLQMERDGRIWVSGSFEAPFADYGIQRPSRLLLKLGDTAEISFDVLFQAAGGGGGGEKAGSAAEAASAPAPAPAPAPTPSIAEVLPSSPKARARAPRKPKPFLSFTYLFPKEQGTAIGRGEALFHSTEAGGAGNKLTCYHCHAKTDERAGLRQADGFIRAGHTLRNAGQRGRYWNGFAQDVGAAATICAKMFLKRPEGLSPEQEKDMAAFVEAISPDPAPELDYRALYRTYDSPIRDPAGGDPVRGKQLADQFCMTCHLDARVGPLLQVGLYEPEWVVRRVRHLEGHQNKLMPTFVMTRLPDSDLRDIVTWLTSPRSAEPIFKRQR